MNRLLADEDVSLMLRDRRDKLRRYRDTFDVVSAMPCRPHFVQHDASLCAGIITAAHTSFIATKWAKRGLFNLLVERFASKYKFRTRSDSICPRPPVGLGMPLFTY